MSEIIYQEDEFANDLLSSINKSTDIKCNDTVLKKLQSYGVGTLVSVKKKMGSSVEILDVEEITEENVLLV